jgi:hypothetical protein
MRQVAEMRHCGLYRTLSAFIYPDWLSARSRYDYDVRKLVEGVEGARLPLPGDEPIREEAATRAPTPAQSADSSPELDSAPEAEDKH